MTLGLLYLTLMTVTAITTLFIHVIDPGRLSPIHLFVPMTLIGVAVTVNARRPGTIARHRRPMIGLSVGALPIAGGSTFTPGRLMDTLFFRVMSAKAGWSDSRIMTMSQCVREIILDTETTGLDPRQGHRIVEIGCLELINHIPTARHFHRYINPECDISEEAVAVHGLTLDRLSREPVFAEIAADFLDFVGDSQMIIHNADFDIGFLNWELGILGLPQLAPTRATCTVKMARRKFPGAPASLDALCRRFAIDNSGRTLHGALLDAQLLAECYIELLGGRQQGLALGIQAVAAAVAVGAVSIQRTPRAHAPSADEIAAHAAMVAMLKAPVWLES